MATYEMFWDCDHCGTTKLLGKSHRHCPACGAAQDPERRYFPPEDEKVAVEDHRYVGADKRCVACDAPNTLLAEHCVNCGAPMDAAKQVAAGAEVDAGAQAGALRPKRAEPEPEDLGGFEASGAAKMAAGGGLFGMGCVGLVGLAVLAIATLFCLNLFWTEPTSVTVTGHSWERSIVVEALQNVDESDWCDKAPAGARERSRTQKERSKRTVPDGETCKTVNVDNGDGTFRAEERCTPKTRSEPVMGDWCTFEVQRWKSSRTERASGSGRQPAPSWPVAKVDGCQTLGCTREGKRTERYTVDFREEDGTPQQCDVPAARWSAMEAGTRWRAEKQLLSGSLSCSSFEPVR